MGGASLQEGKGGGGQRGVGPDDATKHVRDLPDQPHDPVAHLQLRRSSSPTNQESRGPLVLGDAHGLATTPEVAIESSASFREAPLHPPKLLALANSIYSPGDDPRFQHLLKVLLDWGADRVGRAVFLTLFCESIYV